MTYRRLFLCLLIGGTLVLTGVWWGSFKTRMCLVIESPKPPLMHQVLVVQADVELTVYSLPASGWYLHFWSDPAAESVPGGKPDLMGGFEWIDRSSDKAPYGTVHALYRLRFPMWVPYLLFIALAWGFCRVMERRASAR
ncbi:MAG: hypothetical protein EOP88_10260 [Verrucomicrobiaceae bacterium]|nr:MAG: hypothetical protein EOP88_10260 [Verrucomicrobiaceae bacterium]